MNGVWKVEMAQPLKIVFVLSMLPSWSTIVRVWQFDYVGGEQIAPETILLKIFHPPPNIDQMAVPLMKMPYTHLCHQCTNIYILYTLMYMACGQCQKHDKTSMFSDSSFSLIYIYVIMVMAQTYHANVWSCMHGLMVNNEQVKWTESDKTIMPRHTFESILKQTAKSFFSPMFLWKQSVQFITHFRIEHPMIDGWETVADRVPINFLTCRDTKFHVFSRLKQWNSRSIWLWTTACTVCVENVDMTKM